MDALKLAKKCEEKFPILAKEIENIIILEEDVDTQMVRLKCLLLLAIANERKRAMAKG